MKWLLARLREPSTWAGLAAFAGAVAPAVQTHNTGAIVVSVLGAVAAVTSDKPAA